MCRNSEKCSARQVSGAAETAQREILPNAESIRIHIVLTFSFAPNPGPPIETSDFWGDLEELLGLS